MAEGDSTPPTDDRSPKKVPDWASSKESLARQVGNVAGIGFEFLAAVLLPGGLGYWLDGKWSTGPWLMLAGGAFGFFAGLYLMLRAVNRVMR